MNVIPLSTAELEAVALLVEELAEAGQVCGKILRHGLDSSHPDYHNVPNRELLETELGHVRAATCVLAALGVVQMREIHHSCVDKLVKVQQYLHQLPNKVAAKTALTKIV